MSCSALGWSGCCSRGLTGAAGAKGCGNYFDHCSSDCHFHSVTFPLRWRLPSKMARQPSRYPDQAAACYEPRLPSAVAFDWPQRVASAKVALRRPLCTRSHRCRCSHYHHLQKPAQPWLAAYYRCYSASFDRAGLSRRLRFARWSKKSTEVRRLTARCCAADSGGTLATTCLLSCC